MEASVLPRDRKPAGNTATTWLKVIALVFMFIDHAGKMIFPQYEEMRILGRIAFPLYAWCMIVGFHYTRSVPKYLLRILVTGLVSQPLYMLALSHTWSQPNIFLTLFLGLCALWGIREKKYLSHLWAPAAALALASILRADYGWRGVLLFIMLYAVQDSRPGIAAVMTAYALFWASFYGVTKSLFGLTVDLGTLPGFLSQPLSSLMRMQGYIVQWLGNKAGDQDPQQVFRYAAGIVKTDNQAPGVNREGDPAEHPHFRNGGKTHLARVVDKHEHQGDDFQPAGRGVAGRLAGT